MVDDVKADTQQDDATLERVSFWDRFSSWVQKHADFTGQYNIMSMVSSIYAAYKGLKSEPVETFLKVVACVVPQRVSLGKCAILKAGLPNPFLNCITDENIHNLLVSMEGAKVLQQHKAEQASDAQMMKDW